jgi:transposase-like protein
MSKQKPLRTKGQHHTKEFKQSAVKMVLEEQLEVTEVASRLGIPIAMLKRWVNVEVKKNTSKDQNSMKELLLSHKKLEE